jgi:hypothetical protein
MWCSSLVLVILFHHHLPVKELDQLLACSELIDPIISSKVSPSLLIWEICKFLKVWEVCYFAFHVCIGASWPHILKCYPVWVLFSPSVCLHFCIVHWSVSCHLFHSLNFVSWNSGFVFCFIVQLSFPYKSVVKLGYINFYSDVFLAF